MSIGARVERETRTRVLTLSNAPDVPMPYGQGTLAPSHLRITHSQRVGYLYCTAQARLFGYWRSPAGELTTTLEDIDFPDGARYLPDWIHELLAQHCPIGWKMPPRAERVTEQPPQ